MFVETDLVLLEICIIPGDAHAVQHGDVEEGVIVVVGIGDPHPHVVAGVVHHGEGRVDDDHVRDGLPLVSEVGLEGLLGPGFAVPFVGGGGIEHGEGVHPPSLDGLDEGVHGLQVVVYPQAAGEQDAHGHLLRIEGLQVVVAGDVSVHALVVISLAPLLHRFGRIGIGKTQTAGEPLHHPEVVLGSA